MTAGTCHGEEPDTWLLVGPFFGENSSRMGPNIEKNQGGFFSCEDRWRTRENRAHAILVSFAAPTFFFLRTIARSNNTIAL